MYPSLPARGCKTVLQRERNHIIEATERFLADHGPLFIVNLPNRVDRRSEFNDQLARIGLSLDHPRIHIFPAIRPTELAGFPTLGARGCFLSHRSILEQALLAGEGSVILCEDDLDFSTDFLSRLPAVLEVIGRERWDIFYAGYTSHQAGSRVGPEANIFSLPPTHPVRCSHFYIIRGQAIADFYDYLGMMLLRPAGHPDGGPMHYDGAINRFRSDRPDLLALATLPTLGTQRPSRTDIHTLRWFDRAPIIRNIVQFLRQTIRR